MTAPSPTPQRTRQATQQSPEPQGGGRWTAVPSKSGDTGQSPLTWKETPPLWRRAFRGVSVPAAVGVVLFLIAIGITAVIVLRSLGESGVESVDGLAPRQPGQAEHEGRDAANGETAAAVDEANTTLMVHLVGEVKRPGVVELPLGARVLDAIEAAGGATELADLSALNLAREVSDGEQVQVLDVAAAAELLAAGGALAGGAAPSAAQQGSASDGTIHLNTASVDELTQLPGIGPALAQRIIDWREANGRFTDVGQLLEVSGIGEKTLDRLRERVRV